MPIRVGPDADRVRDFAGRLAALVARAYPDTITTEFALARRRERVYVDVARNGFAQAIAAPWCLRRAPNAPVSTPLDWSEVGTALDPGELNLRTVARRLAGADPWAGFFRARQSLVRAMDAVTRM